jgi:chromosome segregation ATPase
MNRNLKIPGKGFENTICHREYLEKMNQNKLKLLDLTNISHNSSKVNCSYTSNSKSIKKIQITLTKSGFEAETVGEEGTAQVIRSPIVKRGKSMSHSMETLQASTPMPKQEDKNPLKKLEQDISALKQQLNSKQNQIQIYQKTISDLSLKFENSKAELLDYQERSSNLIMENKKLKDENETLAKALKFLEHPKDGLQEVLEAKILSIDQDRDEKIEKYNSILTKYISNLHEFLASQEWILSLVSSPYPKKEIQDNKENIFSCFEKLQSEIFYYQSLLSCDKTFEKSYYTSICSSLMHSPSFSPSKATRYTNFHELSPST